MHTKNCKNIYASLYFVIREKSIVVISTIFGFEFKVKNKIKGLNSNNRSMCRKLKVK